MQQRFWTAIIVLLLALSGCATGKAQTLGVTDVPQPNAISLNFENAKQMSNLKSVTGTIEITGGKLEASSSSTSDPGLLVLNHFQAEDASVTVSVLPQQYSIGGIALRAVDPKNYYLLTADPKEGVIALSIYVDGKRLPLAKSLYQFPSNVAYTLTVDVQGASLRAYVDDEGVIDFADMAVRKGRAGLWYSGSVTFDDFSAEKI